MTRLEPEARRSPSALAAALVAWCGAAMCAGAIAAFLVGPQENITELVGLLLMATAIVGLWMAVTATRSIRNLIDRGSVERRGGSRSGPVDQDQR